MKKHKGYLNWEWPNGSMVGDPKDMKKPKEKTYWIVKDPEGDLDVRHFEDTKRDCLGSLLCRTGLEPKGWKKCRQIGWKIVKVKLVECK